VARSRPVARSDESAADDILGWYRDLLDRPADPPWLGLELPDGTPVRPALVGPVWQVGDDGRWLLPERTLGWQQLVHCGLWHQHRQGVPWQFTGEQARFLLWWSAVDDDGRFRYRDGVLQRLKGHGKDPMGANLCGLELCGPCRVDPEGREWNGHPLGVDHPEAWVQTAAVSLEQTKNTMRLFPALFTAEAKRRWGIQVGKEIVHSHGDERMIQAVTSSPATLEGARSTFVLKNETHHWLASNDGHEMAAVIDRNATKSADGAARTLSLTNAYEPGEDSVAEQERDAYGAQVAGTSMVSGLLYDSLEAPPEAPLSVEAAGPVVTAIRGDSTWLDVPRIVQAILDPRNPPSRSRRFWYNQITATEDAWLAPYEWDRIAAPEVVPAAGDQITLGFDGSKTDDHTALIGCLVDLDHVFQIHVWEPDAATGEVDRVDIDRVVRQTFETFDVVGFFSDLHPWESYVDRWAEELGGRLCVKSTVKQPVAFDMRSRTAEFTAACESFHDAVVEEDVSHCGSERMRRHFHNARRAPNRWGISIRKEHRESARKIDSVPAAILARLARQQYLALPKSRQRRKVGEVTASFL
jgi:hypothetical protein